MISHHIEAYAAGKPLFSRDVLQEIDRQLDCGGEFVEIKDFCDVSHKYSLKVPASCKGSAYVPH